LIPIAFVGAGIALYFALREPSKPVVVRKDPKKVLHAHAGKSKKPAQLDLQALYDKARRVLRSGSNNNKSNIRRICMRGIGKLHDDDAFALLTATLKDDPDRTVRSAAAMAIAEMGLPGGVQALEQARRRSAEVMKVWIDEALMRLGQTKGKSGLRDALQSTNKAAQFQAALALGEAGEKAAVEVLKEVARRATLDRTTSIAVLGTLANLGHEASTIALEKALDQSDKVVKLGAAEALAKLEHEKALATLKTLLTDDDITSQLVAGKVLASLGDFSGLERLRKNVMAKEVNIRRLAVEGLGSISDKSAIHPLASALEDNEWVVKATAAESLAKLFALMPSALVRRSQDWIKTALAARDWSVRHAAVGVSSEMDPELAINLLGWAFKDKDPRIRAAAVVSLARLRSRKGVLLLQRALADPAEDVREKAARALGRLNAKSAREALHKTVRDTSPRVGMAAAGSLLAMGDTSYVKDLYKAAQDKNPELRRSAMMALGKGHSPQSDKALKDALSDKSPRVRFAAAYQLAKRGNKFGAAELLKTFRRGGRDGEQAIEALSALGINPQKEISRMAHSRSSKDREMAMANAYRLSPPAAIIVLRQGIEAPEKSVCLAAARSLSRMVKKNKHTIPLLRRLSRNSSPAVRAQANIGLARAKKAHFKELSTLDRGKVQPVQEAPLPPAAQQKPKPPLPKGRAVKKRRPLFVSVNSPQQLYMYNLSRATVATSRGQFKAALRYLNRAFRHKKNNLVVLCEYGYLFHQRALSVLRKGATQKARSDLINARKYYRQCNTRARQPLLRKKAQGGLRDIARTLQQIP
jgi:HEAT repeat protein